MQRDETLQLIREMGAPFRLALREGLLGAAIGVRQVVDARQQRAEGLAVGTMPPTDMPPKPTPW
jgi:hypothetical protein